LLSRRLGLVLFPLLLAAYVTACAQGDGKRGQYVATAAGCVGCHTDVKPGSPPFAGGRALDTPFGTFYGPNITQHPQAGIGRWSEADFVKAMREGVRPDGAHYYPSFPYTSFTRILDQDLRDLWAYLRGLPASPQANRPHDLRLLYRWRFPLPAWKWLYFSSGPFVADSWRSATLNRGNYLVNALGHCGECHTPRNLLGGSQKGRHLAGGKLPDGRTPNLTPARLKKWDDKQLADFLRTGATPEGDVPSETMEEVIRNTTSRLTREDLGAMITYLRSLPSLPDEKK
jgi:mono/diheme cytochrome c family protein